MWFEQTSFVVRQRVKPERDRLGVLRGSVEGVAEVHEECVAAPLEAVLDVRVGEPSSME